MALIYRPDWVSGRLWEQRWGTYDHLNWIGLSGIVRGKRCPRKKCLGDISSRGGVLEGKVGDGVTTASLRLKPSSTHRTQWQQAWLPWPFKSLLRNCPPASACKATCM